MKIRGVVGSVIIIIQLLLRLSRFLFTKKNTSPHYFLQYIPVTRSVTGMYCIVNYL